MCSRAHPNPASKHSNSNSQGLIERNEYEKWFAVEFMLSYVLGSLRLPNETRPRFELKSSHPTYIAAIKSYYTVVCQAMMRRLKCVCGHTHSIYIGQTPQAHIQSTFDTFAIETARAFLRCDRVIAIDQQNGIGLCLRVGLCIQDVVGKSIKNNSSSFKIRVFCFNYMQEANMR